MRWVKVLNNICLDRPLCSWLTTCWRKRVDWRTSRSRCTPELPTPLNEAMAERWTEWRKLWNSLEHPFNSWGFVQNIPFLLDENKWKSCVREHSEFSVMKSSSNESYPFGCYKHAESYTSDFIISNNSRRNPSYAYVGYLANWSSLTKNNVHRDKNHKPITFRFITLRKTANDFRFKVGFCNLDIQLWLTVDMMISTKEPVDKWIQSM